MHEAYNSNTTTRATHSNTEAGYIDPRGLSGDEWGAQRPQIVDLGSTFHGQQDAENGGREAPLVIHGKSVGNSSTTSGNAEANEGVASDDAQAEKAAKAESARAKRWRLSELLWDYSALDSVRACRKYRASFRDKDGNFRRASEVQVRQSATDPAKVGFAGLQTCKSVWACPRCSARIQAQRRIELGCLLAMCEQEGLTIVFSTFTLRHNKGQRLARLWNALGDAQRRVGQDKTVRRLRKEYGEVGSVRVTEVTYGDNGWHPHNHRIQIFTEPLTQAQVDVLMDEEFRAWKAAATKAGLGMPLRKLFAAELVRYDRAAGISSVETLGPYMGVGLTPSKHITPQERSNARKINSMAFEMQGAGTKTARRVNSYTALELLEEFADTGNADCLDRWNEYELASKGRRALVWSPGLKARFGIKERSDEVIAAEELGSVADRVFGIADWAAVVSQPGLPAKILNTLSRDGVEAAMNLCRARGVPLYVEAATEDDDVDSADWEGSRGGA